MLRDRRKGPAAPDGRAAEPQRKPAARRRSTAAAAASGAALPAVAAFLVLAAARLASAALNIIHDCDETFNYLEPLHFVLHGSGMQTWEYSAAFALRSYLYLLLHTPPVAAAAALLGDARGKLTGFYLLRATLGLVSAATEAWLYRAVARRCRPAVAHCLLLFLAVSSGLFAASTALLPSSFTMYAVTAAAAAVLEGRPYAATLAAVVGVVWGWCVAGLAFLPYALWVLAAVPLLPAVGVLALCLAGTLGPLVAVDHHFYGAWTASLWNFVRYNVVGGGDSALYGVEGPLFYLRNGANNFQALLPLALAAPLAASLAGGSLCRPGGKAGGGVGRLLVALAPVYVWAAAITALPHKEERFLYVVYPLICLAAAVSFVALCSLAGGALGAVLPRRAAARLVQAGAALFLAASCLLALSRSAALLVNYGAPMRLYTHLPEVTGPGPEIPVCAGAEWYRFPSSFFLPGPRYRLRFVQSGFTGLLPRQFDASQGGTRAAPPFFNDRNRQEPANFWPSPERCAYLATLRERGGGAVIDALGPGGEAGWEEVAALPFVDNARSPLPYRAFFLPRLSSSKNHVVDYVLLRRKGAAVP